jgi:hypothetical protein
MAALASRRQSRLYDNRRKANNASAKAAPNGSALLA